ncbi:MAG: BlaI/MecI/CopY family transcriptional regulator [Calditrichota bacterium]
METERQLTGLEWDLMNIVWEAGEPVSARTVLETAYPEGEKAYTTVKTVLNTLTKKGFLKKQKIGLVNFYSPTKPRDRVVTKELRYFAQKIFKGSLPQMASFLIGHGELTGQEVEELQQLIHEHSLEKREPEK